MSPRKLTQSPHRASTSLTAEEVETLDQILRGLRGGADLRILARASRATLGRLAIRVATMKASMRARQATLPTTPPAPPKKDTTDGPD